MSNKHTFNLVPVFRNETSKITKLDSYRRATRLVRLQRVFTEF